MQERLQNQVLTGARLVSRGLFQMKIEGIFPRLQFDSMCRSIIMFAWEILLLFRQFGRIVIGLKGASGFLKPIDRDDIASSFQIGRFWKLIMSVGNRANSSCRIHFTISHKPDGPFLNRVSAKCDSPFHRRGSPRPATSNTEQAEDAGEEKERRA